MEPDPSSSSSSRIIRFLSSSFHKIHQSPWNQIHLHQVPQECPQLLHFFQWRILNEESCTKLAKLSKFNLSGSIFINFMEKVSKLFLSWSEAHGSHDLSKIITRQKFLLLCIKQIKANLQALNFISSKVGQVIDLLKVNISIRISPAHGDTSGVLFLLGANSY